jgi:hypothetical protein
VSFEKVLNAAATEKTDQNQKMAAQPLAAFGGTCRASVSRPARSSKQGLFVILAVGRSLVLLI